jgi:signal transduction histidine kinase
LRSLWAEPRVPDPPARVWRDWLLVGVLVPTALLEGLLADDVIWRPAAIVHALLLTGTLLWRRTHPLGVVAFAFGSVIVVTVASVLLDTDGPVGLSTNALLILLPYALTRWGSGREIVIGLTIITVAFVLGTAADDTAAGDVVGGGVVLYFPAVLGAAVRYQTSARMRALDQVKAGEREALARELHDTVAHHVSAIAVQAQAGRTLAGSHPSAAVDALKVIEAEASRTLAEMRLIVSSLRQGEQADRAPQPAVADIQHLARDSEIPRIDVELSGDLNDLRPAVAAAIYRLAQESITNAVRHARRATVIKVRVVGDDDCVRLTVVDDGEGSATRQAALGYGLVGMGERAALLGGTLDAGPTSARGWTVNVVLPKSGAVR